MSKSALADVGFGSYCQPADLPPGVGPVQEREMVDYRPPPPRVEPLPAPQSFEAPLPPLADLKVEAAQMKDERARRRRREYLKTVGRMASGEKLPAELTLSICEAAGKSPDADLLVDLGHSRERGRLLAIAATEAAEQQHASELAAKYDAAEQEAARRRPALIEARRLLDAAELAERIAKQAHDDHGAKLARITSAKRELLERPEFAQFSDPDAIDRAEAVSAARVRCFEASQRSEHFRQKREQARARCNAINNQHADLKHKLSVAQQSGRHAVASGIAEQIRELEEKAVPHVQESLAQAEREFDESRKLAAEADAELKAVGVAT